MSRLPSRSDDHGQGSASGALFASHSRHVMIDRLRRQIVLTPNSTLSSQRSGVASWPSEHPEASQALPMLPCFNPVQYIELQHTTFVSAVTYLLSSLGCLPLTNQNP